MKSPRVPIATLLILLFSPAVLAQGSAPLAPSVAFAPVTAVPVPFQSISGRFSSLDPPHQRPCPSYNNARVIGRVVSTRLIMVDYIPCTRGQGINVLVNVELSDPADAVQMVTGRRVAITASFKRAWENRTFEFGADYVIAEKAELVAGDPIDRSVPAFTSYMICQPPELDVLAKQLGNDLCVQSTIVAGLTKSGPALEAAARALANSAFIDMVSDDPNAITCRQDPGNSDRLLSAIACARNSYWTWYDIKWHNYSYQTPAPP